MPLVLVWFFLCILIVHYDILNFAVQHKAEGIQGFGGDRQSLLHSVQCIRRDAFFENQMIFCDVFLE